MSILFDEHSNFPYSTVQAGSSIIGSAGSPKTIVLGTGDGTYFPLGNGTAQWNVVVWPPSARPLGTNAEIIRVTRSGDTLTTVGRGQEGTAALSTISAGYQVMAAVTKKTLTDIEQQLVNGIQYQVVDRQYNLSVANTITETTIYSYTVAANALGTTKELYVKLNGDWKQNSGSARDSPRFRIKFGGVTLLDTNVISSNVVQNDTVRYPWDMEVRIENLNVANSQWIATNGEVLDKKNNDGAAQFATGVGVYHTTTPNFDQILFAGANSGGIDTTAAQLFEITVQLPNAVNTDMIAKKASAAIIG